MINEKYEIAKHIVQEIDDVDCSYDKLYCTHIMMKDYKIYNIKTYKNLYKSNKILLSDNAYVYIEYLSADDLADDHLPVTYFHPLIHDLYPLIYAYLSKYSNFRNITPAVGLKYFANVTRFSDIKQVVVEIIDFDAVASNIGLPSAIRNVLGNEYYEYEEYIDAYTIDDIANDIDSRSLFGGYGFTKALAILLVYYAYRDKPLPEDVEKILESNYGINAKSLGKVVESIKNDYKRIFNPFRVIYDIKTNQFRVE